MRISLTPFIKSLTLDKGFTHTCSDRMPSAYGIGFATNEDAAQRLGKYQGPLFIFCKAGLSGFFKRFHQWIIAEHPFYEWTLVHNAIAPPWAWGAAAPLIHPNAKLHESAVLTEPGIRIVQLPDGVNIPVAHTGRTCIRDGAIIGPHAVVHRALLDMTIIDEHAVVGSLCNVGHNSFIGASSVLSANVSIAGSVTIGKNCFFGVGSCVKNGVSVCDDVTVGAGAVVVKNITEPGRYVGVPARKIGEL